MKIARWKKVGFVIVSLVFILQAHSVKAALYVEITGGRASGLPIAIVPFQLTGASNGELEDIAQIVRSDLDNSGQFKATPMQSITQFPADKASVQYGYWKNLSVEDIVIGRVEKKGGLRYSVQFELLDVVRAKEGTGQTPLLALKFDNIQPHEFRALAHHISDLIFEKLIGIKGIFSTRIAYVSVNQASKGLIYSLEVADSDGHNPKALHRSLFPMMSPAWSPDGKKLAYVSFEKDRASIHVVDVITGKEEQITQYPGINGAPAWSPDGRTLAVVLSKDGGPKIYTVDVASKQITRLTDGSGIDTEPSWAKDGRSIVFTSNRGGKPQIYRVTLGTGKIDRVTFAGNYNAKPSLTPDGKRLVMLHRDDEGLFSIAVQTLNTGEMKILTQASLNDSPSLAPNGMMVMYGAKEEGRGVLGAVSLDGRVRIRLPAREGNVQEPAWSPFASHANSEK